MIHCQPPGSYLCGYYAVMNVHELHGFPAPSLETLQQISPPNERGTVTCWEQTKMLEALGWQVARVGIAPDSTAKALLPGLLASGFGVLLMHNHLAGLGGIFHSVVAKEAKVAGVRVWCSIKGESFISWDMFNRGDDIGISHDLVIARPPLAPAKELVMP